MLYIHIFYFYSFMFHFLVHKMVLCAVLLFTYLTYFFTGNWFTDWDGRCAI